MNTVHPLPTITLTGRDRSVLRAVRAGRCLLSCTGPLVVDGIGCCDQFLGPRLVRAGLIDAPGPEPEPARLTPSGLAVLAAPVDGLARSPFSAASPGTSATGVSEKAA